MNRWHQKLSPDAYRDRDPRDLYRERLATVQEALDLIQDGDCLTWSTHGSEPKVFLEHLHTMAPRLDKGVDCWNTITRYTYPVTSDPRPGGEVPPPHLLLRQMVGGGPGERAVLPFPGGPAPVCPGIQACKAPNVFVAQVSNMDKHGYVHLSCDPHHDLREPVPGG